MLMNIAEVSKLYDISQDTLRSYEQIGMIPPVTRTEGGKRDYQEEDLRWVELVKCMRRVGLPVKSIVEYVTLYMEGDQTIPDRLELLQEQRLELEEQKARIDQMIQRLSWKIERYKEAQITGVLNWEKKEDL